MIWAIVAVVVVAAAVAGWLMVRRRRRPMTAPILRDPATVAVHGLSDGLAKSRRALGERLGALVGRGLDEAFWEGVEEALISADVGVAATAEIVDRVRKRSPSDVGEARAALHDELIATFSDADRGLVRTGDPAVILVVGVNGSGKTTTIAKLAALLQRDGLPALLGAADTFRAAAAEQLATWADRLDLDIVSGQPGSDPASVAFDAYSAAKARGKGVVIVDTAGRLHSKQNLMDELSKVVRVLGRESGGVGEVLLVLDGTTGQNGIAQARAFTEAVGVTGIVVTKLDGSARGGVAVAVEHDLGIPVKYIGVGEAVDDLMPFDPVAFVDALLEDA